MAKPRGRPSKGKDEGLVPITILLAPDVKRSLEEMAAGEGRPLSEVVRRQLAQGVAKSSDRLTPGQALSRLIELHADDVAPYCQAAREWQAEMEESIPVLIAALFGDTKGSAGIGNKRIAATFARTLAQRVRRAHLAVGRMSGDAWAARADDAALSVQPSLAAALADELARIQTALGLAPSTREKR